jgi:hypothetical protein
MFVIIVACFVVDIRLGLVVSTVIFAIFSLLLINKMMTSRRIAENFTYVNPCNDSNKPFSYSNKPSPYHNAYSGVQKCKPGSLSYNCAKLNMDPFKTRPVIVDKNMVSINNALQGGPNPKTLVPPMIVTPVYSLAQRDNDMIVPNRINSKTNEDLYLSGYLSNQTDDNLMLYKNKAKKQEDVVENFTYPAADYTAQGWSNEVNMADGYNPEQWIESKFPANLPQGNCPQQPEFSEYHNKLFTNTVQPGVTYRDNVIEPINANIGISFQQQFLPRTYSRSDNGELAVVDHDPKFAPSPEVIIGNNEVIEPVEYNVYDPRMTGYGTSYRNYVDDVTGQPRFPYDDINAVRMPNYLVRSKIDTHDFADKYGPIRNAQPLEEIRPKVQNAFLQDTSDHRNDIMTSLMRKRNAEMWQIRQGPKYTSAGRSLGGRH